MMKKIVIAAIAALAIAAPTASTATMAAAEQATYTGYRCIARSPSAAGIWVHENLAYSQRQALVQCSARTPSYQTCYITRCDWGTWSF